ncbi:uncharacterized protein LOC108333749 isoform X2 [Vigna angularis]|uniref:uncharacterized protein LOC108333749 isoform X2 n=1 Tax=Phaseolus angularis TaxID=3914 RepID=UPI000809E885|nr:uncharacterized protein LOC108333749 isoform X2 [Vigna angularis]
MWFFVSCFGGAADPTASTKSVVPPPSRTLRRKPQWKPTLGSISENTAPPHRERATTAESAGDIKKSENSATTKSHRRHFSEGSDYGRVTVGAMPAFSPTPFIF